MQEIKSILEQVANRPASTISPKPSRDSLPTTGQTPEEFVKAMVALVALKRTADLTRPQMQAWYAILGGFPAPILNAAVIELALTKERFPEVGDLYAICRRSLPKDYSPMGDGKENDRPSRKEIAAVAERLGLEIE